MNQDRTQRSTNNTAHATTANPLSAGVDFMQSLMRATSGMNPVINHSSAWGLPQWSSQDLEQRIKELKTVLLWVEQNATALKATIQALEVQKMTLATLQSMQIDAEQWAQSLQTYAKDSTEKPSQPRSASSAEHNQEPQHTPSTTMNTMWEALLQQFQTIAQAAQEQMTHAQQALGQQNHRTAETNEQQSSNPLKWQRLLKK